MGTLNIEHEIRTSPHACQAVRLRKLFSLSLSAFLYASKKEDQDDGN